MTVMLYLMRHGIAEDASRDGSDAERALTDEGIRKTTQVAEGLRALDLQLDAIISSPLRRAQETARIAAKVLAPDREVELTPLLAGGSAAAAIASGLRLPRRAAQVLLVGHQPGLGELASHLLTGSAHRIPLPFKKAGVAAIEVDGLPAKSAGILHWFAPPALLRAASQK
ncbi:phosphohistidine phosphatase SixA [bacterium]|nr:phosphohistidine phosphatase SixA [bacterium]